MASPLEQDAAAFALMEHAGLEMVRLPERVIVDDPSRVPLQYQRRQPDKGAIRKAILAGEQVPGARMADPAWLLIPKRKEAGILLEQPAPDVPHSPGAGEPKTEEAS